MNEESIFLEALQLQTPKERAAFLDRVCVGNEGLRCSVEMLLKAHEKAGDFLKRPSASAGHTEDQPSSEGPGTVIGAYKLLQPIGEGGMGAVFMAEQQQPVQRKVALKVIKPGMDSKQVIARFEAERQALALMDHPHIAKVFDGGTTASGRPYFVMELVKGVPLTKYCDEHHLTPRERLELFVPVCQAVQHAHQKGIIHRDLKPSNVMIALYDGRPVPKVIDFGIAKATGQQLTQKTLFTDFGAVVGTLEYMSPEQAELNQLDIDTRSDIYSLGALLYELLTGTTPLEQKRLRETPLLELLRVIREEEPPAPSTRLGTTEELPAIAANRGLEPKKLSGLVRGELDWIVMKCLEKDRNRRYETANGLAHDIERYLHDEPVLACPPSAWYRFRKFARRNRLGLAVAGLILFFLVLLGGGVGWAARDYAARTAALQREVENALEETHSFYKQDKLPDAMAAVKRAKGLLASSGGSEELQQRVEQWRKHLDLVARLEEIRLERAALKGGDFDWAGADRAYQQAFRGYGLDLDALGPDEAVERIGDSAIKDNLVAALDDWAQVKRAARLPGWEGLLAVVRRADPNPWRDRLRDAFQRRDYKALEGLARDPAVLAQPPTTVCFLGTGLSAMGQIPLAVEVLRQAQRRRPADFWINHELSSGLWRLGPAQAAEAVAFARVALAQRPQSPVAHVILGNALHAQGKLPEAAAEFREADHLKPGYAMPHYNLGNVLRDQGKYPEAEAAYQETLRRSPNMVIAHINLGHLYFSQKKHADAEAQLQKATRHGPNEPMAHYNLGQVLFAQGKYAEAKTALQKAVHLWPDYAPSHYLLAILYEAQKQLAEAEAEFRQVVRLEPKNLAAYSNLCRLLEQQGKLLQSEAEFRAAFRLTPGTPFIREGLLRILREQGKTPPDVEEVLREVVRRNPMDAAAHIQFGEFLAQQRNLGEAESEYRQAIRLLPDHASLRRILGWVLEQRGLRAEAVAVYKEAIRLQADSWDAQGFLARLLTTCPEPNLRDTPRALEAARKAVELAPQAVMTWEALGWAEYRAGNWQASITALEKAIALLPKDREGGDGWQLFFLAMAHWQLGHRDEARKLYDRAARWMARNGVTNEQLLGFQAEAAGVLKIDYPSKTKPPSK
jgi:tetratricopeptide (TPR) repeat protein/tRNA A-37 threonylcarbamoyl transferase component Bud32